jgi:uncharacterized protein YfaS (alpha-2-macroglobulin family)
MHGPPSLPVEERHMRQFGIALLSILFLAFGAVAQTPQKTFNDDSLASDFTRLEERLKKENASVSPQKQAAELARDATQLVARGRHKDALRPLAAAIVASPRDPVLWLSYSRAAFSAGINANGSDSYQLREDATAAAYGSYLRASARNDEASALAYLGDMYVKREMWRPALNAYRASLERNNAPAVRAAYEPVLAEHGFHVLTEKIDSDSASPRACFPFSEPLARGKVDFTPYVAISGGGSTAVTTDDQQLCVEGLKHGERYSIVLRQGLPSSVGETLLKNADFEIYVRDRSPQVRFTGKNYVLPRVGQEGIPLVSVNTQLVSVDVLRVGDRNLLQAVRSSDFLAQIGAYKAKKIVNETGVKVWSGTLDVKPDLNKDVITAFPVMEAVPKLEPGVYVMVARAGDKGVTAGLPAPAKPKAKSDDSEDDSADNSGDDNDSDSYAMVGTQWFVVSDIGLTSFSGTDGIHVLTRSLATAAPMAGVEVRLIARNNEVLATRTTAADGHIKFDPGLARGLGGMAPGLVVASDATADYNFLDLGGAPFDLTDRGVKGRDAPKALDAYVYAERGVYRSGETVNVTTLLRDPRGQASAGLPLTLVAKRPDGVEYKRASVNDQGLGARAWSIDLLPGIATGTWRVQAYADPKGQPIGDTSFLVEDYVPERLDLVLKPRDAIVRLNQPTKVDVDVRYLYGAPGSNLDITGDVTLRAVEDGAVPNMPGYVAGLQDEEFEAVKNDLEETTTTDDKGKATIEVPIPDAKGPRPLEAKIILRAGETGGRAIERTVTLPVRSDSGLIAVKSNADNLAGGATATFDIVALGPNGQRIAKKNLIWSLYRVTNDYQWYRSDAKWGFERVKSSRRLSDGRIDVASDGPARIATAVEWGAHRLDLKSDDGSLAPTSITFEVGWSGDASAETPDLLQVTLDKANYRNGETMKVAVNSRFDGKATLAIVGDKVEDIQTFDVKAGDNSVQIPVKADWGSSAYAVAIAHRPLDRAAKRMPGRALGLAWFGVDQDAHGLTVAIDAPAKMEPRRSLSIPVRVGGLAAGEDAYITLAAVDVGILNLTHYEAPDATKFYFGQRLLGAEVRDLYGYLIDGMQGARGAIHFGGDGGAQLQGARPTQEPLSRYSGLVKVGPDGVAQVTFDIPAFNGTMRVMAVAWSKGKVGQASSDVIVRDPVVVQATLPRFLSLGDQSRMHMQIANLEAPAGDYRVDLDIHGPVTIPADALRRTVKLPVGGKAEVSIPVTAGGVGRATIDLALTGPNIKATQSFALNVTSGAAELYRRSVRDIAPGTNVTISGDLLGDFVPGTGAVHVAVSSLGAIDVPALLQALDRYPYGCSEQIVSRAMPLLYVNRLASTELLPIDPKLNDRIKDSIDRVMTRQGTNGAFGLWAPGGDDDIWLHAFVTDFLTRAREGNFAVPQKAFDQALDFLRNTVVNVNEIDKDMADGIAYAIYVLARNGRPVMSDLRYLADTKLSSFASPLARAQLAAALALLGDRGRARAVFSSAGDQLASAPVSKFSRADYGSQLRDSAGLLALGAEAGADRAELVKASLTLEKARSTSRYTSTQENAWMVLAAEALTKETQNLALTVDGTPHQGALYRHWAGLSLDGASVTIGNTGQTPARLVLTTSGNPSVPEPAAEQGYRVERQFFTLDGKKLDMAKAVTQTQRFVVSLKVTELESAYARLLLVDHLPAGIEIDNPDLFDGGSVDDLAFLKRKVEPTHTEARDDRFVAAFDRNGSEQADFTVAYIARAVTPGRYVMPPATIEDMYRPERFGRTASGSLEVTEKR